VTLNINYRHQMQQIITVVTCAFFICGSSLAKESENTSLNVDVGFNDGHSATFKIDKNHDLVINTCAGKLRFPYKKISKIELTDNSDAGRVHLRSGDLWTTTIDDNVIEKLGAKNINEMIDRHGKIKTVHINYLQPANEQKQVHYMKLVMDDGSQALINPAKLLIPLETVNGKWDIPIGSLRALKFITPSESDEPDTVIVRFHTGLIKRMQLGNVKNYIRATDSIGNKLKVYHHDIMGILNSTEFEDDSTNIINSATNQNTSKITLNDGQTITTSLPVSIWRFKTGAGTMLVPSSMISSLKVNSDEKETQTLTTIFGEIFSGELMMHQIQTLNSGDAYVDIDGIKEVNTDTPTMKIPENWFVWYLKSGTAMIGRFADATELITEDDIEVQPSMITSLTPATDDHLFVDISKDGEIKTYKTKSKKVNIALLTTGMTVPIPWKEICIVKYQKEITANNFHTLPVRIETKPDDSLDEEVENKPESTAKKVKLKTVIGTLELQPTAFAKINIDNAASRMCVTSIYGDKFITSIPTKKWIKALQTTEDYEYPEDDVFTINLEKLQTPTPSPKTFVCRLISGDIIHGELPEQELNIKKNDSKSAPINVDISKLQQISRDDEGNLSFHLQRGNIIATPKQKHLQVVLLINGNSSEILFKQIESLVINSSELPPTTCFHQGMPAALKGEILVEGGSFMQGSEQGMSDEIPVHTTSVSSFYMDSTEVTRAQFAAFIRDTGYETLAEQTKSETTWRTPGFIQRQTDPAVCISWYDAIEYCNWRSRKTGLSKCYTINKDKTVESDRNAKGYRLPTESEWEFAARNRGLNNTYAWENKYSDLHKSANFNQNTLSTDNWAWTNPVKAFPANGLGIFGLSGNAWEWCEDIYFDMAYSALRNNQVHNPCITHDTAPGLNRRVMRGGSFKNRLDLLRCTSRGNGQPFAFSNHVGFRCVRNAED